MPVIETRGLKYTYPDGTPAIRDVNIRIKEGKKVAFVGPNGAGKSTLFLLLNGTLRPTEGEVLFHGEPLRYDSKSLREIRRRVGIVFQNSDDQLFAPTVYQDVAFGPVNLGFEPEKVKRYVGYALDYVGLSELADRPPHHLSGGQKKRASIAGVIVMEPDVIILDEPTSNLDPEGAEEIIDLLSELNYHGKTIIVSTHDVELAYQWSDYIYLMVGGEIIGEGTPEDVFGNRALVKRAKLRRPTVLEIYDELARRGIASLGRMPRSVLELVDALEPGVVVDTDQQGTGRIWIYDTDHYERSALTGIVEDGIVVGVMGTRSKRLAAAEGIRVDIASNVIDKSILMAQCGKRCLILTNGGMVEHAKRRIEDYCEQSGVSIEVGVLEQQKA